MLVAGILRLVAKARVVLRCRSNLDPLSTRRSPRGFGPSSCFLLCRGAPANDIEAEDRRRLGRLREALAGLPQQTRDVFIAHCIDDLDYGVIAARLGISVADVQREFARAMAVLDDAGTDRD